MRAAARDRLIVHAAVKAPSMWRGDDPHSARANVAFARARENVLKRDRFACVGCGSSAAVAAAVRLEVHHRDNDHSNNERSNLVTLCRFCHAPFHAGFHALPLKNAIKSWWWLAYDPVGPELQTRISRWAWGLDERVCLPAGSWMDKEERANLVDHLALDAEGLHSAPEEVEYLVARSVWIPDPRKACKPVEPLRVARVKDDEDPGDGLPTALSRFTEGLMRLGIRLRG